MRFQRSEHCKLMIVVRIALLSMLLSGTVGCLRANPTGDLFAVSIAPQTSIHKDEQALSTALTGPYLGFLTLDACAKYKNEGDTTLYAGRALWSHEAMCAEFIVNNSSSEDMRIDLNDVQFTPLAVKKNWRNRGKVFPVFGGMHYSDVGNSLMFIDEIHSDITPFQPSNRNPERISRDELRSLFYEERKNIDSLIEGVPASLTIPSQGVSLIRVCFRVGYIKEGICELPISFESSDERVIARIHLKLARIYFDFGPEGDVEGIEKIVFYDE